MSKYKVGQKVKVRAPVSVPSSNIVRGKTYDATVVYVRGDAWHATTVSIDAIDAGVCITDDTNDDAPPEMECSWLDYKAKWEIIE